ncbi:DNA damage-regulated autophagy modulator protein 1-like [Actinia tenebrosa]|uniref:DNA damage-regulated autophagy modulator protein 1-like n=1 Tax=Actinia tenebrosa TaxID=6105 RepID=A0A6P8H9J0_ACTTE|nr:DNA damage-regulated autophagy modulator protein 1-like [Actinia tenebrosa]
MEVEYQAITVGEENQNTQASADEPRDKNRGSPEETSDVVPRVSLERRVGVHQKICCWKCLTSEYFLFGIPALPITFAVLILLALIINYAIAVSLGHVAPFLPYVSWLASNSPEEYIFDFMMSLVAINVAFIIYFKFKVIADNYKGPHLVILLILNKTCAWIGFLGSLLFLLSATFPYVYEKRIAKVHSIASISAFSLLCLYFIIETVLSFKIQYQVRRVTLCISVARAVFAVLASICLIVAATTGKLAYKLLEKGKDEKQWKAGDGGYELHVTAAICEWSLVFLMVAFFLTYISELDSHVTEMKVSYRHSNLASLEEV